MTDVTIGKNGTSYRRKFDWDEARARYADGESLTVIARSLGVSYMAVYRVTHADYFDAQARRQAAWQKGGVCSDCGKAGVTRGARSKGRCRECAARAMMHANDTHARCASCKEWKPLSEFHKNSANTYRRVRNDCRECNTAYKREWRNRNREHLRAYERARKARVA